MPQKRLAEYFCDHKDELSQIDQRSDFLSRIADKYDLAHITYFCLPETVEGEHSSRLITTYSDDWKDHYFASGYVEIDPVLRDGVRKFLPFDWSELNPKSAIEKQFFGEAREFGIYDFGLTVPVRGSDGRIALFSVNSKLSQTDWDHYKHKNVSEILHFAHLFHHAIASEISGCEAKAVLTRREKQVLFWAGRGKTCWETAKILGLTERTVDFYMRNASHKLGAATKTQAVAKAIADGQIFHTVDPG